MQSEKATSKESTSDGEGRGPPGRSVWYVEYRGERIGLLTDPQFADMFWTSFRLVPLTKKPEVLASLYTDGFWNQCEASGVVFRHAPSGRRSSHGFPALNPAAGLADSGRICVRAPWLDKPRHRRVLTPLWRLRVGVRRWLRSHSLS